MTEAEAREFKESPGRGTEEERRVGKPHFLPDTDAKRLTLQQILERHLHPGSPDPPALPLL